MTEVLKAGMLDSFQDAGRVGMAHWGISKGGCMDAVAATIANALVGNAATTAVLEMHYPAPELLFTQAARISLCGADFSPRLNGAPVGMWRTVHVPAGTRLSFGKKIAGQRCYLAVAGGWQLSQVLNSYSTHLSAGFGGWLGRALQRGDAIPHAQSFAYTGSNWQQQPSYVPPAPLYKDELHTGAKGTTVSPTEAQPHTIFVMPGPETEQLPDGVKSLQLAGPFILQAESNRMGYRLQGSALQVQQAATMLSGPVLPGTLQLLPSGQLVVLMADAQTTGGYPRVGQVIAAHMHRLAQLGPGERIVFLPATVQQAVDLEARLQAAVLQLQKNICCMLQGR